MRPALFGKRLIEAIPQRAGELGLAAARLETGIHQPQAIGLYRAYGFTEIGPFGGYKPDPLSIFMEKRLS
jgi:putative acetyltransferase